MNHSTYEYLSSLLTGDREGTRPDTIVKILEARFDKLKKVWEPFDKPSAVSKKKIESGSVVLADGVRITFEDTDKQLVFAISDHFQIDQIEALILLRSFLYNEGLPETAGTASKSTTVDEILTVITPFYYSERVNIVRTLIALLQCQSISSDPLNKSAFTMLPKIIDDPTDYVQKLISTFLEKTRLPIPEKASRNLRSASLWAKQNAKEQLVLVEAVFWLLWDYVPSKAPLVLSVFEAAYDSGFGCRQENSTSMLDEEGTQIQQDLSGLWVLMTIEVLDLEHLSDPGVQLVDTADNTGPLHASPQTLEKIHQLVMAHTSHGYVCTMLAWGLYLKAICGAASLLAERPPHYLPFLREIRASQEVSFKKGEKELHANIVAMCLRPESGLFVFLLTLLTRSPLFATAVAWKTASSITYPNAVSYRAILKGSYFCVPIHDVIIHHCLLGLIMGLMDYEPIEFIPDFEGFVEVWIALFASSESADSAALARQYWDMDWKLGKSRRAIIDVARSRFPVQFRPLVRLLRALTGFSHADTSGPESRTVQSAANENQRECSNYVFYYFLKLPSYTQIIPAASRTGANSLYDRILDRPGPSTASSGTAYANLRPVTLPGGSILPQKSVGRLLCSDSSSDPVIVAWQHEHSGWKVLVDVLIDYINRRQGPSRSSRSGIINQRKADTPTILHFDEIGLEREENEELAIADALNLVLSAIEGNPAQTELLIQSLEGGGTPVSYTSKDAPVPDLVQLIFMILEHALSSSKGNRSASVSPLISPAFGVLSALLSLPSYSNRVWLYLRSTTMLFSSDAESTRKSVALAAERSTGEYTMTIALLRLVRSLFEEAIASLLSTQQEQPRLQAIKEEVLLRALRYIHGQIWLEHSGWRYVRLGDRFEISRSVISLFSRVIQTMSAVTSAHTFASLSEFVSEVLIHRATPSTITLLVHTIASGESIMNTLTGLRRFAEARKYASLLAATLLLTRLVLYLKSVSSVSSKLTLLEQMLCQDHSVGNMLVRSTSGRVNPVDKLGLYVKGRDWGTRIPVEATRALTALCASLSSCTPTPPSLISQFNDAQATLAAIVKILQHPYDDLALRNALWSFLCVAVEKQPAFAVLVVSGKFRVKSLKGKEKEGSTENPDDLFTSTVNSSSAVEAACKTLAGWKELWEANPQLLSSVMKFLDVVWNRSLEHIMTQEPSKGDSAYWKHICAIASEELGPFPDYSTPQIVDSVVEFRSNLHDPISDHAYRTQTKAHALRILGSDAAMELHSGKERGKAPSPPQNIKIFSSLFSSEEQLSEAIHEATSSPYDPELYDRLEELLKASFSPLSIDSLRAPEPTTEREFGDNFLLSITLLNDILQVALMGGGDDASNSEQVQTLALSVNLNMSLSHAQLFLGEAWCFLLEHIKGYLRGNNSIRTTILSTVALESREIARESRSGDFMCTIHSRRLRLILALLEAAWFSSKDTKTQIKGLMSILESVGGMIGSEAFPPSKSFLRLTSNVFHQSLLQIIYFCAKSCAQLGTDSGDLTAEYRLLMSRTFTSSLLLVIDALRLTFDIARTRMDVELDRDMELLVAVFQQCTRQGLNASSSTWLTRCQETDVIGASLQVLAQVDLSGFSDLALLRSHGQPLYSPHVLLFHQALATIPFTAERLASENVVAAYSNNSISVALSEGVVDTSLPELPGERSPAHKAYCLMLAILAGIINSLQSPHQFIEFQVVGFVQLYGKQISRCLSWNNDDSLTLPSLEELEYTLGLFYLMVEGSSSNCRSGTALAPVLSAYAEHTLQLLQQLNYALTHPKHLAGLLDPITPEERIIIDRETNDLTVTSLNDLLDETKRPTISKVAHKLLGIATRVLDTLTVLGGAETVLLSDSEEWPLKETAIIPVCPFLLTYHLNTDISPAFEGDNGRTSLYRHFTGARKLCLRDPAVPVREKTSFRR